MAGIIPPPPLTPEVYERTREAARSLPNLEVRGHLAQHRLADFFSSGALFLHTSPLEGFPNTMLEAWAHGLPSVSVVDPDGIVGREAIRRDRGPTSRGSKPRSARWMGDPARRSTAGARARSYVAERHAPARIVDATAGVMDQVIRAVRARR
jgi:glycosyltransferase involved in cell wall biosynthesis